MSYGRAMFYFKGHHKAAGACQKQHSPIFISVTDQRDAQNLFYNNLYMS